ncbi:MAG TPA: helix-turn-helix domain-containing GNAT family N-acetyltransferase [Bryobacteraceae bacterium]|nr:helix-turn-helix domain-containing GNAT family N-acetyltransferase [Bryobacteraceae bacterium]
MPVIASDSRVDAVRGFNRFYTRQIGLLDQGYLESPFSLTEVRVLFELAHRERPTSTELAKALGLDAGYLSRILQGFEKRGLVTRRPSETDARQSHLSLSSRGHAAFRRLDQKAHHQIAGILGKLPRSEQNRLIGALAVVQSLLGGRTETKTPYLLRSHQPGDIGWVIHRHGALYAQEYGWDETFEALVAEIGAKFIQHFNPKRERCWIAERDGEIVGSVFLVEKSKTVAKLRLLLVEPKARGLGIGARLVQECVRFARQTGYRKVTLWTQSNLSAARHIYKKSGFRIIASRPNHSFGHDLVSETWELAL